MLYRCFLDNLIVVRSAGDNQYTLSYAGRVGLYYVAILLAFNNCYRTAIEEVSKRHDPIEKSVSF
jgi:hypothetical protein